VTLKYMRFLYHEDRSTGSIEEPRGHTDSMERQGANGCVAGKERILKYKLYHHFVLVLFFVCPLHLYIWNNRPAFTNPSM